LGCPRDREADHSDVGDHIVIRHAQSEEAQDGIRRAVGTSLGMWWQFFDGIEHEVNAA
jgi:pyrroloquinoline quinone (PQQ) biosynthesis protein C